MTRTGALVITVLLLTLFSPLFISGLRALAAGGTRETAHGIFDLVFFALIGFGIFRMLMSKVKKS